MMAKALSDLAAGDPVEVRKARRNRETGLGEEFWEPATVLGVGPIWVEVAFSDGSRAAYDRRQRMLRSIEKHIADADKDVQAAVVIARVLIDCEAGGPYGSGCMVDSDSGPTAVRIDGLFNLVEVARKVCEMLGEQAI